MVAPRTQQAHQKRVEKIVELKLSGDELAQLKKSAYHVLENVKRLNL